MDTNDAMEVLDSRLLFLSGAGGGVFLDAIDDLGPERFNDGVSAVSTCKISDSTHELSKLLM